MRHPIHRPQKRTKNAVACGSVAGDYDVLPGCDRRIQDLTHFLRDDAVFDQIVDGLAGSDRATDGDAETIGHGWKDRSHVQPVRQRRVHSAGFGRGLGRPLRRVQVLGAQGLPAAQSGDLVTSSIDVLVQASVLSDGSLKIIEIAEPKSTLDGQVSSHALLTWIPGEDGLGSFTVTGARSALAAKLSSAGNSLPTEILNHQ